MKHVVLPARVQARVTKVTLTYKNEILTRAVTALVRKDQLGGWPMLVAIAGAEILVDGKKAGLLERVTVETAALTLTFGAGRRLAKAMATLLENEEVVVTKVTVAFGGDERAANWIGDDITIEPSQRALPLQPVAGEQAGAQA